MKPRISLPIVFIGALLLAVFLPQPEVLGFAVQPFEFPSALYAVLIGLISTFVTQGLKERFPLIANALAILVSAVVTTVLGFLAGLINTNVDTTFWPLLMEGVKILISWLSTWTFYKVFRNLFRPPLLISGELKSSKEIYTEPIARKGR